MNEEVEMDNQAHCYRNITNPDDKLVWDWSYAEAVECGWAWSQSESLLVLSTILQPSYNINKMINTLIVQGLAITISTFPNKVDLRCRFENHVTLSAGFTGEFAPTEAPDSDPDAVTPTQPPLAGSVVTLDDAVVVEGFGDGNNVDENGVPEFNIGGPIKFQVKFPNILD